MLVDADVMLHVPLQHMRCSHQNCNRYLPHSIFLEILSQCEASPAKEPYAWHGTWACSIVSKALCCRSG